MITLRELIMEPYLQVCAPRVPVPEVLPWNPVPWGGVGHHCLVHFLRLQTVVQVRADDMGLGKTLQVLATSWALMNAHGPTGRPIVRKMLIVSPSSVCNNWAKEIKKWLGPFHGECHRVLMPGKGAINLVRFLACFISSCTFARWPIIQMVGMLLSTATVRIVDDCMTAFLT